MTDESTATSIHMMALAGMRPDAIALALNLDEFEVRRILSKQPPRQPPPPRVA